MARQVMFDPFGSYTQGFDQGAGRQIQTEGATRQARAQDYDFNTLAPYRLNAVKREDELGNASLPVQKELLGFTIPNAQANLYDKIRPQALNFAQTYNTPAPLQSLDYSRFGITPTTTSVGGHQQQTLYMQGPTGEMIPVSTQQDFGQTALDNIDWQRRLQAQQLFNTQQYQSGMLQNTAARNDAYQVTAQARMMGALGRYYQGAGGLSGTSLFGSGMPTDLMGAGYYQGPEQMPQQMPQQMPVNPELQDFNIGVQ